MFSGVMRCNRRSCPVAPPTPSTRQLRPLSSSFTVMDQRCHGALFVFPRKGLTGLQSYLSPSFLHFILFTGCKEGGGEGNLGVHCSFFFFLRQRGTRSFHHPLAEKERLIVSWFISQNHTSSLSFPRLFPFNLTSSPFSPHTHYSRSLLGA